MSAAQLDRTLQDYIRVGHYRYFRIPAPAQISEKTYTSRPLTSADAAAILADIHLHSPDYQDKAVEEFQAILKSDPDNAAASRGLGYAYLQKQDFTLAAEYFKKASEHDSKDPRVHYYSALLMARESGFSSKADIPRMTKELETSISLDPNFAESYAMLAFAQTMSGDHAKALDTMRKAISIDPRNESYRINLANIYLANRQQEKAVAILESLQKSTTPEIASRAASTLENIRQFQESDPSRLTLRQRESADSSPMPASSKTPVPERATDIAKWGPPLFLRGTITAVDCSVEPSAVLNLSSGSKAVKLKIANKQHVVLIGADQFSCSWSHRKVAINYRQSDAGDTNVISLELQ